MTTKNPYTNNVSTNNPFTLNNRKHWIKYITYKKIISILFLTLIAYSHITFFSNILPQVSLPHDHHPHSVPMEFFMESSSSTGSQGKPKLPKRRRIKDQKYRRNRSEYKKLLFKDAKKAATKEPAPQEKKERIDLDKCSYIHKNALETTVYPSCNIVHEVSMTGNNFRYLTAGTARATWLSKDATSATIVFKISKWSRVDFSPHGFYQNRKDGMTLEALSSSDYIMKIFGYCGTSQILELGDGGNVQDLIQRSRDGKVNLSYIDRLKVSIQLATSVADLHEYAHASHRDICCHQFVNVNGIYKLNDFHLTKYTSHVPRTKQVCMSETADDYPKIHAPEEYYGIDHNNWWIDAEKADVYMLGNIMYNVLTNKWTFENYNRDESWKRLSKGITPDIPSVILAANKTDTSVNVLLRGIQMCWIRDVGNRPTARFVANFLLTELKNIAGEENVPDVIQVDVPPLEKDYSYSDAGFYKYLYRKDNVDIDHSEF